MKEQIEEKQNLEVSNFITKAGDFIETNKNRIGIIVGAIVVVVVAFFALRAWYFEPRSEEAAESMFMAENLFAQNDYEKALNGDDEVVGFLDIISDYSGTKSANLARYYAGICELRLGKYEEASEHLRKYSASDTYTESIALMLRGDAELELGNDKEAVSLYQKAADKGNNFVVAPTALFKAGMTLLAQGDNKKAIDCFNRIKENYPESTEYAEVDKYIGYAEAVK